MENNHVSVPAWPIIIQGGMGIGVSHWGLAQAVARTGQLGVVSGTALATVLARRLQEGDPAGDLRRALAACPLPSAVQRIRDRYYVAGGLPPDKPYQATPLYSTQPAPALLELTLVAAFVEVFLAKEGHDGPVGINLLEKIQLPTLPTLYGAMLAGVDYVIMGAGIPRAIPAVLDAFAAGQPAELRIDVAELPAALEPASPPPSPVTVSLSPAAYAGARPLRRPHFLAVVSSAAVALTLARKASGQVDGFIIEGSTAGGHNAPPRGGALDPDGAPLYGPRDEVDLSAIRALGRPFWLAGSWAHPDKLKQARELGAQGVQLGTVFAFCAESGMTPAFKVAVMQQDTVTLTTDGQASPTGMPFKVVGLPDTLSEPAVYDERERRCDLGYLRQAYRQSDGGIGYRCPAEPAEDYVRKGGREGDTMGRKCLCNGLLGTIGLGQRLADGRREPAILTAGTDLKELARDFAPPSTPYTVDDVLRFMGVTPA